jgi:hypothetical protein
MIELNVTPSGTMPTMSLNLSNMYEHDENSPTWPAMQAFHNTMLGSENPSKTAPPSAISAQFPYAWIRVDATGDKPS